MNTGKEVDSVPLKLEQRQKQIDIREAFNIGDVLNSKVLAAERLQTWETWCTTWI